MQAFQQTRAHLLSAALIALICSTTGVNAYAASFEGQCVRVLDGDTVEVMHEGAPERIRLDGIDCPEKKQAFGQNAKAFTSTLVFNKTVEVTWTKRDRYGRLIGLVTLSDGRELNQELVKAGYAWWYKKYSANMRLSRLEQGARDSKIGLWSAAGQIPPWTYRHTKRDSSGT